MWARRHPPTTGSASGTCTTRAEVTAAAAAVGWERRGLTDSPITGAQGNKEFLMLLEARS